MAARLPGHTESARNTFTRPPVWGGERVLVWLGIVERRVSPHGWLEKSPASCVQAIKEPPPYAVSHFEDLVRASLVALSRQQLSRARAGSSAVARMRTATGDAQRRISGAESRKPFRQSGLIQDASAEPARSFDGFGPRLRRQRSQVLSCSSGHSPGRERCFERWPLHSLMHILWAHRIRSLCWLRRRTESLISFGVGTLGGGPRLTPRASGRRLSSFFIWHTTRSASAIAFVLP